MDLQIRWFDAIRVNDISRQLVHSFCYFWSYNAPSHRVKHVDKLCRRVSDARVGCYLPYLGYLDGRLGEGRRETQNTETMSVPERQNGRASFFPGREVTGKSLRKRQALRKMFNGRVKTQLPEDYLYPSKRSFVLPNLSSNEFL